MIARNLLYMQRHLYILILLVLGVAALPVRAQNPTSTPVAGDPQLVAPEDLKGVPNIASDYRSTVRGLPDLGRDRWARYCEENRRP